jgi:hypothetical protein
LVWKIRVALLLTDFVEESLKLQPAPGGIAQAPFNAIDSSFWRKPTTG